MVKVMHFFFFVLKVILSFFVLLFSKYTRSELHVVLAFIACYIYITFFVTY